MLTTALVPARPMALARILLAGGAALTTYEGAHLLGRLQGDVITTPVHDWLPRATDVPVATWFLVVTAACLSLALGVLARASAGVIAVGQMLLMAADLQLYSNHRFLLVLLCCCFVAARSDHWLAVGASSRRDGSGRVPWWPGLLAVAAVSSCYTYAGLSKANPTFLGGDVVATMSPDWAPAVLISWTTVPVELAIGLGLWWRPTRRWALALGAGLHLSIIVLLGDPLAFGAFALICASAYPLAWTWAVPATEAPSPSPPSTDGAPSPA